MLKITPILSVLISMLFFLIVVFKQRRNSYQKILLLIYVISLSYYCVLVLLVKSSMILEFPHFWHTGTPVNYLHLTVFIIFVRSVVKDFKAPKRLDYILITLPLLVFLAITPFYIKDVAFKTDSICYFIDNQDIIFHMNQGYLPGYPNYLFQFILGIILSSFAIYMIVNVLNKKEKRSVRSELIWLICISAIMFLGNSIGLTALVFDSPSFGTHSLVSYLFAMGVILIFLYPFFQPKILYRGLEVGHKKKDIPKYLSPEFSLEELKPYKKQIEGFFITDTAFLSPDFRQDDLANFLGVSKNNLSKIINNIYQKNFNQLINEKRIDLVLEKFENSYWLNYSLEGVSREVGFKSRTTFIKAFKEKTGSNPSEFKKKQNNKTL